MNENKDFFQILSKIDNDNKDQYAKRRQLLEEQSGLELFMHEVIEQKDDKSFDLLIKFARLLGVPFLLIFTKFVDQVGIQKWIELIQNKVIFENMYLVNKIEFDLLDQIQLNTLFPENYLWANLDELNIQLQNIYFSLESGFEKESKVQRIHIFPFDQDYLEITVQQLQFFQLYFPNIRMDDNPQLKAYLEKLSEEQASKIMEFLDSLIINAENQSEKLNEYQISEFQTQILNEFIEDLAQIQSLLMKFQIFQEINLKKSRISIKKSMSDDKGQKKQKQQEDKNNSNDKSQNITQVNTSETQQFINKEAQKDENSTKQTKNTQIQNKIENENLIKQQRPISPTPYGYINPARAELINQPDRKVQEPKAEENQVEEDQVDNNVSKTLNNIQHSEQDGASKEGISPGKIPINYVEIPKNVNNVIQLNLENSNIRTQIYSKTFFTQDQYISELEGVRYEFQNYWFPIEENDQKFIIQKTILSFLNTRGGWLIFGIRDDNGKTIGLQLTHKQQDEFARFFNSLVKEMKVDPAMNSEFAYHHTYFMPMKNESGKWMKGWWIPIVRISQGDPYSLYTFQERTDDQREKMICYIRQQGELSPLVGQDFKEHLCSRFLKKEKVIKGEEIAYVDELPEPKPDQKGVTQCQLYDDDNKKFVDYKQGQELYYQKK